MLPKDPLSTLFVLVVSIEAVALGLLLAAAVLTGRRVRPPRLGRAVVEWLGASTPRSVGAVFVLCLGLCAALGMLHTPVPRIHDEFCYLLAADTFAHGRIANPTPPLAEHFESEHILVRPTYASKYPPAQGLLLGAAQALTGQPLVGAWLGAAGAAAAICWMLRAWLPARWALLGGFIAAVHPGVVAWWGHSSWGGSLAALGGALLFGSVRRLAGDLRWRDGLVLGVGLGLLANTRPYEGLVAATGAGVMLAVSLWRGKAPIGRVVARVAAPAALALAPIGAWDAYYNSKVTGDALRMPYAEHWARYCATPMFVFQDPPRPPEYRDRKLRDFHEGWELDVWKRQHSTYLVAQESFRKSLMVWGFYFGPPLTIGLLGLGPTPRRCRRRVRRPDPWVAAAGAACGWSMTMTFLCVWFHTFYLAPIMGLLLFLGIEGLRRVRAAGPLGRRIVLASVATQVVGIAAVLTAGPGVLGQRDWSVARAEMERSLVERGGKHLVIVRNGRDYAPMQEWVYNAADLASSPVVWARELESQSVPALLEQYKDRRAWLLEVYRPNGQPPTLSPYPITPAWLNRPPLRLDVGAVRNVAILRIAGEREPTIALAMNDGGAIRLVKRDSGGRLGAASGPMDGSLGDVLAAAQWSGPNITADLDGDGAPEGVETGATTDMVLIQPGQAGGAAPITLHTGVQPVAVCIADVDHDGRADLCIATMFGHGLTVLRNLGALTFAAPTEVTLDGTTWYADKATSIAAADLDGDGIDDLVVGTVNGCEVFLSAPASPPSATRE